MNENNNIYENLDDPQQGGDPADTQLDFVEEDQGSQNNHSTRNNNKPSILFSNNESSTHYSNPPSSLNFPLQILFFLNGASLSFPGLALMSLINDYVKIPLVYLSAYGAISFLPWSFKPLYALLEKIILRQKCMKGKRHILISVLLCLSGICYILTSFLVYFPSSSSTTLDDNSEEENKNVDTETDTNTTVIVICFLLGFIRAVCGAFPEFLLGLTLLDQAQKDAKEMIRMEELMHNEDQDKKVNHIKSNQRTLSSLPIGYCHDDEEEKEKEGSEYNNLHREEVMKENFDEISGIYQSQAATARNVGSFSATIVLFCIVYLRSFLFFPDQSNNHQNLTKRMVMNLLLSTGLLPILGSFIGFKFKVGSSSLSEEERDQMIYSSISTTPPDDDFSGLHQHDNNETDYSSHSSNTHNNEESEVQTQSTTQSRTTSRFILLIILFQLMLITGCLKSTISKNPLIFWSILCFLSLLFTLVLGSLLSLTKKRESSSSSTTSAEAVSPINLKTALFLVLWHAGPNASYQWSSFTYYLFEAKPLTLQSLHILSSIMSTLGSYIYAKYIASAILSTPQSCCSNNNKNKKKQSSLKASSYLIRVFIWTTFITAIISLLYLIPVSLYNGESDNTNGGSISIHQGLFWLIFIISTLSSFFNEIAFLPSVVLATNSVEINNTNNKEEDDSQVSTTVSSSSSLEGERFLQQQQQQKEEKEMTGGDTKNLQYGTYVACIDFGDQIGSWITVPLVSFLNMQRGQRWEHLSTLLIVCAIMKLFSLPLLFLIRKRSSS